MGRLLVLIVIIVAAVWLVRRALPAAQAKRSPEESPPEKPASQELVRCARCALLLPRGEARMAGGAIYCSDEHARLGAKP
jgi:uncharacterized protein